MSHRKKDQNQNPPRLAEKFLEWFCKDEWIEPVKGDLYQQYQIDLTNQSRRLSKLRYWLNVFNFLRPFALKKHHLTSNYVAMLRNIIKTFVRQLVRNPLQNAVNILGLCIGFTVVFLAIFWINYHQSFDTFHSQASQTFKVMTTSQSSNGEFQTTEGGIYEVLEEANNNIPEIDNMTRLISNWRWPSQQCFKIDKDQSCIYGKGVFADSSFFHVFDFEIISGEENPLLNPKSIALSETIAAKLYGDENPVGKTYKIDNHFEVIISAVYKDIPTNSSLQFDFVAPLDVAYRLWGQNIESAKEYSFLTYLTLEGDAPTNVQNQINELTIADKYENLNILLHPLEDVHLKAKFENGVAVGGLIDYIRIIGLFALFILIMSMVNFINLTTAQSSFRGKEIGVRKVNGASKFALQFQFLFETFFKVILAASIALLIAYFTIPMINSVIDENIVFSIDLYLGLQILFVILLTTVLSGLYPAVVMSRFNPIAILKNLQFKGGNKSKARSWLTIAQISISSIIVILTSAFYLQLDYLQSKDIGYDKEGIMILEPTYQHIKNFQSFTNGLKQHPQIKSVGVSNANMVNADFSTDEISWKGKDISDKVYFKLIGGDAGLLDVFEMELFAGLSFNSQDTTDQVILTEAAVKQMNLTDPVGQTISLFGEPCKVMGIVKNFNSESLHESLMPTIIYHIPPERAGTYYVRYDKNDPVKSIELIESEYDLLEPFFDMKFQILNEEYQRLYNDEKVISQLSIFAMIVALIIASIGILGLSTFNILRRYREIGLRKIFGASSFQVIRLLSKEFVLIALVANLIAWPFSLWVINNWLSGFAYRIGTPYEMLLLNLALSIGIILILVGLQSARVSRLNPTQVIKSE